MEEILCKLVEILVVEIMRRWVERKNPKETSASSNAPLRHI